jgi:hypothetical protein
MMEVVAWLTLGFAGLSIYFAIDAYRSAKKTEAIAKRLSEKAPVPRVR